MYVLLESPFPSVSTVSRGRLSSLSGFQAAEETKKIIPGRAAETISIIHFNDVYNVESREVSPIKLNMKTTIRKSSFLGVFYQVLYIRIDTILAILKYGTL
jgi:hypothetical protein